MSYYAQGDAVFVFSTTDEGICDTVKDCIEEYLFGYEFEFEIGDDEIIVRAWGNDKYRTEDITEMLEKLKALAPLKDGSEYDFQGEDNEFWRFILKNGEWKEQSGRIVYDD